jgi:hypothetical protein
VSTANGIVTCRLLYLRPSRSPAMLVEMWMPNRLRVQVFENTQATSAAFTSAALIYIG